MKIIIHRGARQIGGCVTEISTENSKVFIDFGADLPDSTTDKPLKQVEGLTVSDGSTAALFLTHYHGDHTGRIGEVLPEIPIYIGETAKEILVAYSEHVRSKDFERIKSFFTFKPLDHIHVGDISVTPLRVDHSAFDSYMFIIEAGGKRILHTGDFRLHGFLGNRTPEVLKKYATNIDYMICENTNLDREAGFIHSEWELKAEARKIMLENKYVFVICTSTNIDRIRAFYAANPKERLFICSEFQKSLLQIVQNKNGKFYDFSRAMDYATNLDSLMEERGFCAIVRRDEDFAGLMEKYKDKSAVIYSMWGGYLKGKTRIKELADFLKGYKPIFCHVSGHAFTDDILSVFEAVKPKHGFIPIHGETPEKLFEMIPKDKLILLKDGEKLTL